MRDDIKEKGLSGEEVYARGTWRFTYLGIVMTAGFCLYDQNLCARRYKLKMLRPVSAGPLYSYNIYSLLHCLSNLLLKESTGVGA